MRERVVNRNQSKPTSFYPWLLAPAIFSSGQVNPTHELCLYRYIKTKFSLLGIGLAAMSPSSYPFKVWTFEGFAFFLWRLVLRSPEPAQNKSSGCLFNRSLLLPGPNFSNWNLDQCDPLSIILLWFYLWSMVRPFFLFTKEKPELLKLVGKLGNKRATSLQYTNASF